MKLSEYFQSSNGTGILATSNSSGQVDVAIYARPHFIDEQTVAFIMKDGLSHENLQSNPHAAYLFVERGEGYQGRRLYLTKLTEETDPQKIDALRRRPLPAECSAESGSRFLVHFHVDRVRPVVGDGQEARR
ncbi:MAG: pyridoxamine 5'-phosphate oxidase family protein [Planctomycetaceae bacterium]|nr:pyridoxamine 5'-phosphate oxidase family protein [Planctomycetaceae bacterium]